MGCLRRSASGVGRQPAVTAPQTIIGYIKNQQEHHRETNYLEELKQILEQHNISFENWHLD